MDMDEKFTRLESSRYVLLPVAYDGTSTFMKGADHGPQAILDASDSLELYDPVYDLEAYISGIYTDHYTYDFRTPETMVESVYHRVHSFLEQQKTVGLLGGEHSISIGAIKATSEFFPDLSVLQIDAHADLREEYMGSMNNHACVMRRAQECTDVVQVGIRSICKEELPYVVDDNIFYAHQIQDNEAWMDKASRRLSRHVYLSIDLDGLDPSELPATGTPMPGGLRWYSLLSFLEKVIKNHTIVAFDVVELCPHPHDKRSDVLSALLVYKIITMIQFYANCF